MTFESPLEDDGPGTSRAGAENESDAVNDPHNCTFEHKRMILFVEEKKAILRETGISGVC